MLLVWASWLWRVQGSPPAQSPRPHLQVCSEGRGWTSDRRYSFSVLYVTSQSNGRSESLWFCNVHCYCALEMGYSAELMGQLFRKGCYFVSLCKSPMDQNLYFICKLGKQNECLSPPHLETCPAIPTIYIMEHLNFQSVIQGNRSYLSGFLHVWINVCERRRAKSKVCPSGHSRTFLGVSREQPRVNVHLCLSFSSVRKPAFSWELKRSGCCQPLSPCSCLKPGEPVSGGDMDGDGAFWMSMACPLRPPQAWSRPGSWEHLLLRAVCFNPLKDLSAKSSMEWCSVVFEKVPRGFELDRLRTNPFTRDG